MDFEKSRIASEKLQLAWIKANITFIGLGFAVYKFYQSRLEHGQLPMAHYIIGRHDGIFPNIVAVGALSLTTWQHFNKVAQLKMKYGKRYYSAALLLSYIMLGFDLIVLALIIFHLRDFFCDNINDVQNLFQTVL